jgi:hypothetical protein
MERQTNAIARPAGGRFGFGVLLGAAVTVAYLALIWIYWEQINDDAFITFRYSKFLATGLGPYYNLGERVEGYTNFLLMLLLSAAIRLLGDGAVLLVAKLIGVGAGLASVALAWALATDLLRRDERTAATASLTGALAAGVVATNSAFAVNATTGLETTLFSAFVCLGVYLSQAANGERWNGAGIAFALAALTRPEGAMLFGAACVGRLLAGEVRSTIGRRALLVDALIVAAVVAGHVGCRYLLYDGELLPNTYFAKMGGFNWRVSSWGYVYGFATSHLGGLIALLALLPMFSTPAIRRAALPATLVLGWGVASVFLTGADWMMGFRLLVPYLPIWAALSIAGLGAVNLRWASRPVLLTAFAGTALLVGLFLLQLPSLLTYRWHVELRRIGYIDGHQAVAEWIEKRGHPGQTIALMDIGIIGYRCIAFNILDITGLTNRYIAKSPGPFLRKEFDPKYVFNRKPEFLVISYSAPEAAIVPRDVAQLEPWTFSEAMVTTDADFATHYVRVRQPSAEDPPLSQLAAALGAEEGFEHKHPGPHDFLLVFRYHE